MSQDEAFCVEYEEYAKIAFELMDLTSVKYNDNMNECVEEAISKAEQTIHAKLLEINAYNIGRTISADEAMNEICATIRLSEKLVELYTHYSIIVDMVSHLDEFNGLFIEANLDIDFHNQNLIYLYNTTYEICSEVMTNLR